MTTATSALRISGLVSGIDTDSIITKLMQAQQIPLDKLNQKKQIIQWQRDDYRNMNTKIYDYRNNKLFNYTLESTFLAKKVDVTGNTSAVTAKATGSAIASTMTIDVTTLATAASNHSSSSIIANPAAFNVSKTIGELADAGAISGTFTKTGSLFDTKTITINGTNVTIDPNTDTMSSIVAKINKTTDVSAFYDAAQGKVSFIAKQTGLVNDLANSTGEFITFSGDFLTDTLKVSTGSTESHAATNAAYTVNNMSTTSTSNKFTINGIEITLNSNTAGTATLNVSSDTDKVVDAIKSYISDYNDMLKTLNDKVSEARYRDFTPLTDAQKTDMKDTDITNWTDKAKSGLLKGDSILTAAIQRMRMDTMTPVNTGDSRYTTLSSIGIQTGDYSEKGKLYLADESKLRAAIEANPDAVKNLFTSTGSAGDGSDVGVARRLFTDLQSTLNSITQKAGNPNLSSDSMANDGSIIGRSLYDLGQQILSTNDKIQQMQERYYTQFTAMEQAIQRMNSQSAYLSSMFGTGS